MVRELWTSKVREDSKGQKTITVPIDADINGGDTIKYKRTENFATENINKALDAAIDSFDKKHFDQNDWATPDTVEVTRYICNCGEGRDMCAREKNSLRDLAEHQRDVHDLNVSKDDLVKGEDYHESISIQKMFLQHGLLTEFLRQIDIENRDLYAEDVADRLEEIANHTGLTQKAKLEKVDEYVEELRNRSS
jgi:hypothetical protein